MLKVESLLLLPEGGYGQPERADVLCPASGDLKMVLWVLEVMDLGLLRRRAVQTSHRAKAVVPMMIPLRKVKVTMMVVALNRQAEHLNTVPTKPGSNLPAPTLCSLGHPSNSRKAASFIWKRRIAGNSSITLRGRVVEKSLKRWIHAGMRVGAG
jgi:hypothetical protein